MTLDQIVADYIRVYRSAARSEMQFYEKQRSASSAIQMASLCVRPDGKRHAHQCRTPKAVLQEVGIRLRSVERGLKSAPDFSALHGFVEREIGGIRGVGALTVYDVTQRLGAYFGKSPTLVYLHTGTREGAAVFGIKGKSFPPTRLPRAFSRLTAAEIEDCLCIYKKQLLSTRNTPTLSTAGQFHTTSVSKCLDSGQSRRSGVSSECKSSARRRVVVC
jgi:hypothetical protein